MSFPAGHLPDRLDHHDRSARDDADVALPLAGTEGAHEKKEKQTTRKEIK